MQQCLVAHQGRVNPFVEPFYPHRLAGFGNPCHHRIYLDLAFQFGAHRFKRRCLGNADIFEPDDMPAEPGFDRLGCFARFQRHHGGLERGDHPAHAEPAQITPRRAAARIARMLPGEFGKFGTFRKLRTQGLRLFQRFDEDVRGIEFDPRLFRGKARRIGFGHGIFGQRSLGDGAQAVVGDVLAFDDLDKTALGRAEGAAGLGDGRLFDQLVEHVVEQIGIGPAAQLLRNPFVENDHVAKRNLDAVDPCNHRVCVGAIGGRHPGRKHGKRESRRPNLSELHGIAFPLRSRPCRGVDTGRAAPYIADWFGGRRAALPFLTEVHRVSREAVGGGQPDGTHDPVRETPRGDVMLGLGTLTRKVFGTPNDRKVKAVRPLVAAINALEDECKARSDAELVEKTEELKARVAGGAKLDDVLVEAFANCREAARRALGLRAFDVQLIGGIFLHRGNIAEMKTGEGKTLVATFPAYLNALTGKGVHIVTVNDYLAKRDADWMGKVYARLGLTTGVVYPLQPEQEKKGAYGADITYATNNELGFDYLRDNMKSELEQMNQRGHHFAIVDEVDSILIDEARTPLIISGPSQDRSDLYTAVDRLVPAITEEHFSLDEKTRNVTYTDEGNEFIEEKLHESGILPEGQSLYDPESTTIVHHVTQALRAHKLFQRDQHYIVRSGEVVLIDEFTGRMMPGRRLSDGLHQAIEAKEGCPIQPENVTLASVTFQNYFRLYEKLAGMTGTAATEAEEFREIYGLDVIEVPTNLPIARQDEHDQVYRTAREKYDGILEEIKQAHERGQPILVGTTSIEKSEFLSGMMQKEGIAHNVLNARQHEQEAKIVAEAGRLGAVTIATNMAGRGTDIQLGGNVEMQVLEALAENPDTDPAETRARIEAEVAEEKRKVIEAGGLFVLATERHESRRIDNQLRGRSGRQGDPGRSAFFLSLEDDLMRIFGSDRLDKVLSTLGMKEGEAIVHPWVNKSLEKAQAKVEARNFDIRKQLLKFDDVMNDQRRVIFGQRLEIMRAADLSEIARDMRHQVVDDLVDTHLPPKTYAEQWDTEGLAEAGRETLNLDIPAADWADEDGVDQEVVRERLYEQSDAMMAEKLELFGAETLRSIEKQVLLQTIDAKWREHLLTLEHLRSVVGFRGHAQRDPLIEYKTEAFTLFESMLNALRVDVTRKLAAIRPLTEEEQKEMMRQLALQQHAMQVAAENEGERPVPLVDGFDETDPSTWGNPGRNDPCPCGSGRKFKHCHGRLA